MLPRRNVTYLKCYLDEMWLYEMLHRRNVTHTKRVLYKMLHERYPIRNLPRRNVTYEMWPIWNVTQTKCYPEEM